MKLRKARAVSAEVKEVTAQYVSGRKKEKCPKVQRVLDDLP